MAAHKGTSRVRSRVPQRSVHRISERRGAAGRPHGDAPAPEAEPEERRRPEEAPALGAEAAGGGGCSG